MSDGAATLLQCANCAAPLSPPAPGQIDLVCHYCGGTTRIADANAHDKHAKHGHTGPSEDELARRRAQSERDRAKNAEEARQADEDEGARRHAQSLRDKARQLREANEAKQNEVDATARKKRGRLALLIPVILVVGGVAVFFGFRTYRAKLASFPLSCGKAEALTLSNRTFDGPGVAVIASNGCKLTIQDSSIKADQIVRADSPDATDIVVTIVRSKLEARGVAIDVSAKAKISITDKSDVYGANGAVVGNGLSVNVQDSKLRGDTMVAKCASLTATNATFEGNHTALAVSTVSLRQSRVTADVGLLCESTYDFKVTLDASTIDAKSLGLSATAGHLGLSTGSLIKGGIAGVDAKGVMLSIDTSRIVGGTTGLHAKALLQIVSAKSSTIAGGTSAIVYEYPAKPSLDGITLEGAYSNH